jgi:hypothetical protein
MLRSIILLICLTGLLLVVRRRVVVGVWVLGWREIAVYLRCVAAMMLCLVLLEDHHL